VSYTGSQTNSLSGNANITGTNVPLIQLSADTSIACLRNASTNALTTIDIGGNNLTTGGILESSAASGPLVITNGNLRGPGGDLTLFDNNGSQAITIYASVVDNGGASALTKGAAGTVVLAGANNYSGVTYINAGTLQVGAGGTSGNLGSSTSVTNTGTLAFNRSDAVSYSGFVSGIGGLSKQGAGTLTLAGDNTYSGTTTISAGTLQIGSGGGAGSISNSAVANSGMLIFNRTGTVGQNKPINGTGALTVMGGGTLILFGTNTYSGATTISGSTLALGPNASISNSVTISMASTFDVSAVSGFTLNGVGGINQTLTGSGNVVGGLTSVFGATIDPGGTGLIGTLAFSSTLVLNGGTYKFDVATTNHDLITVGSDLTCAGGTIQLNTLNPLTNGIYKLIAYSGNLIAGASNLVVSGFSQSGQLAFLKDTTSGEIDLVVMAAAGANLNWAGNNPSCDWDVNTTANFLNFATPSVFHQFDNTRFDDSASCFGVNLVGIVTPASVVVSNSGNAYTFSTTGNGLISGATVLTKDGSSSLTVLTTNDYSGTTTIKAGSIMIGNGSSSGNIGVGNVTNNGALEYDIPDTQVLAGTMSGTGTLTLDGAGTVVLGANNTYGGLTTINAGTLQVGQGGPSGTLGTGAVTDNGSLLFNRTGTTTVNNGISGSGTFAKIGSATMTYGGVNTYLGNTYISNGIVKLAASEVIPDAGTVPSSTGWLILDGGATVAGTLDMNGFNETVNGLAGLGGTVVGIVTNSASSGTNKLTVASIADTTFNGIITDNPSGARVALVKLGGNTLRMNNNSTYGGGTFVGAGTLAFGPGANLGSASVTLSNGTTFSMLNNGGNSSFPGNNFFTPPGATATITSSQLGNGYGGTMIGDGTATNVMTAAGSFNASNVKQQNSFTGMVQIASGAEWRYSSTSLTVNGGDNTLFDVEGTLETRNGTAGGAGISLGALMGSSSGNLKGNIVVSTTSSNSLYVIGYKGIDSTYSGTIQDGGIGFVTIIKVGAGTLTLDGTLSYSGNTTISNGILALASFNNQVTSLDSSATISLDGGILDVSQRGDSTLNLGNSISQRLIGSGTIRGNVTNNANSTISPGHSIGVITVTNIVSIAGTNIMELNRTNSPTCDQIISPSIFALSGSTLLVSNLGPDLVTGDVYHLFSTPVSGPFTTVVLPANNAANTISYVWTNKLSVDGTLVVLSGASAAPNPTNLNAFWTSTNTVVLSWPANQGYHLQAQTNPITTGFQSNSWVTITAGDTTNQMILPINPANGTVFYRLVYP
jgi:autotransporter-associated beta strand protein